MSEEKKKLEPVVNGGVTVHKKSKGTGKLLPVPAHTLYMLL